MKNWEEDIYSKNAPSAEDLQVIEEGIDDIIKDSKSNFEAKDKDENKNAGGEIVQGSNGKIKLSKFELDSIDEMVRIIEDPNYISAVRARRLGIEEDESDSELSEMSFDENGRLSHDDVMSEYRDLQF